jgi:hypothetical protein
MPTYEAEARFKQEYKRLRPDQRAQFKRTLQEFIQVMRNLEREQRSGVPSFPAHLGGDAST